MSSYISYNLIYFEIYREKKFFIYKMFTFPPIQSSGSGQWICAHNYAFSCNTYEKQLQFISFFENMCRTLNCPNCREHAIQYLERNPLRSYLQKTRGKDTDGESLAMFEYTCRFHNDVNRRLDKPIYSYHEIKQAYKNPSACTDSICSIDHVETPSTLQSIPTSPKNNHLTSFQTSTPILKTWRDLLKYS